MDRILPTGKLPLEFLNQLLGRVGVTHERLITGPGIGEDVAVIDMGSTYMVVKTDPITFATDQIGWYAVHVNANDVATSGATPLWMLNTLLLPEGRTTRELVEEIFAQLRGAADALGIHLVGGHTEVTHGLDRPIVVGVLIGEVPKERLLTTASAKVGDSVILVKGIPIEAVSVIAYEKADELRERGYDEAFVRRCQGFLHDPGISVLEAARIAADVAGVHAMHDPTEGGLATGLQELALAANTGLWLDADRIPILEEGAELCTAYGLDPLGSIASGALLVTVSDDGVGDLLARYREAGIPAARIGRLTRPEQGMRMLRGDVEGPLVRFDVDEITRIFS
ncbi:MAG: AIR synthase family protein [Anaerolineae bacterium]